MTWQKHKQRIASDARCYSFCILLYRKYPIFAPHEIMNLSHHIRHDVCRNIVLAFNVHHQPYHNGSNDGIQRTYYRKAEYTYSVLSFVYLQLLFNINFQVQFIQLFLVEESRSV